MDKRDLVEFVAQEAELTKTKAEQAVNATMDGITAALAEGHKVVLVGFGVFEVKASKARMGRNPKTGEEIEIAAKNTPKFRPGKTLKEAVNG